MKSRASMWKEAYKDHKWEEAGQQLHPIFKKPRVLASWDLYC